MQLEIEYVSFRSWMKFCYGILVEGFDDWSLVPVFYIYSSLNEQNDAAPTLGIPVPVDGHLTGPNQVQVAGDGRGDLGHTQTLPGSVSPCAMRRRKCRKDVERKRRRSVFDRNPKISRSVGSVDGSGSRGSLWLEIFT